jgi:hypothetical protein
VNSTLHSARSSRAAAYHRPIMPPRPYALRLGRSTSDAALSSSLSAIHSLSSQLSAVGHSLTLLFVAFPYVSPATPLSSAFTHLHGGCGVAGLRCSFALLMFQYLLSDLFSTACRLLPLSLQRFHPSLPLFSATYRHFFAHTGGGGLSRKIAPIKSAALRLFFFCFKSAVSLRQRRLLDLQT